jgi:hypothetical protein
MLSWDEELPTVMAGSPTGKEESNKKAFLYHCGSDSDMQNKLSAIMPAANELLQPSPTPPQWFTRGRVLFISLTTANTMDLKTFKEVVKLAHWQVAMGEKYFSLLKNKTWETCKCHDAYKTAKHVIECKFVLKTEMNADSSLCYKANLVIKGYEQVLEENFDETFVPVAVMDTKEYNHQLHQNLFTCDNLTSESRDSNITNETIIHESKPSTDYILTVQI